MICENCKNKKECSYYETNIEPVLKTELQYGCGTDKYLMALYLALENYGCEYKEVEE